MRGLQQIRWVKVLGSLAVLVLVMTGCIKIESTIQVNDDGSGTVDFLTAINPSALTSVLGDFEIPESEIGGSEELCADFSADTDDEVPAGAVVTAYNEDGFCGSRVTYDLPATTDQSGQLTDTFDETTRLFKDGDNWIFETAIDTDDITGDAETAPDEIFNALFGDASFVITVDLPGRAVEGANNATAVGDDGVFVWEIDILNPPTRLFAETEPGSGGGDGSGVSIGNVDGSGGDDDGGTSPLLIIGLLALILAAAAGAFWFFKQKNGADIASPAVAATDQPVPAGVGAPGATAAALPLSDQTPITAAPSSAMGAARETVAMDSTSMGGAAQPGAAQPGVSQTPATEPVVASAPTDPVYDEALGAWVVNDPTRGRLRHDPVTNTWIPA